MISTYARTYGFFAIASVLIPSSSLLAESFTFSETSLNGVTVTSNTTGSDSVSQITEVSVHNTTPEGTVGEIRTTDLNGTFVIPIFIPSNTTDDFSTPIIHFSNTMDVNNAVTPTESQVSTYSFDASPSVPSVSIEGINDFSNANSTFNAEQHVVTFPSSEIPVSQTDPVFEIAAGPDFRLMAHATANQETTPVFSNGFGRGSFELFGDGLQYFIEMNDLISPITAMHFHRGMPGESGPVLHPISFEGTVARGLWILSAEERSLLLSGKLYMNVHTSLYPDGEIRGQILTF